MSRDLIRDLYRKCARYICNHTVDPSQALEMWELEAPSRLLRYLDPGKVLAYIMVQVSWGMI